MTPEQRTQRARSAKELLENPLLLEALQAVEVAYWKQFKDSPARDTEGREKIYMGLKSLEDAKQYLRAYIEDGELAQALINEAESGIKPFS